MLLGFTFCFALLLYMEVQITPDFLFPHDMFVFQQDPDSYLNVLQRPRVFGILPEGLADIWAVPETVVLSFFVVSEARGGEFCHLTFLTLDFSIYSFLTPYWDKMCCCC